MTAPPARTARSHDEPLGPALGDDRHAIAGLHAQLAEPERDIADRSKNSLLDMPAIVAPAHASHQERFRDPAQDVKWQVRDRLHVDLRLFRCRNSTGHGQIIVGTRRSQVAGRSR